VAEAGAVAASAEAAVEGLVALAVEVQEAVAPVEAGSCKVKEEQRYYGRRKTDH